MSFEWAQFLALAKALATTPDRDHGGEPESDEAALRSAISRAYYAAFHHAKSYLVAKDPYLSLPPDGRAHEEVPKHLKGHGRTRAELGAGEKLNRLRFSRRRADYEQSSKHGLRKEVDQALRNAELVLEQLRTSTTQ